jgi:glutamyl-tRNA(Gln) amidotransferase subunit E
LSPMAVDEAGVRTSSDLNPSTDPVLDFPDRDYGEMGPGDYEALGFMSGLEVHQQLCTQRKLFCRCPAGRFTTRVDAVVLRHMRPTLSELGEYDGTALMEFKTRKEIVYLLERESVCTYEMDDTPPFEIDEEAVDVSIEIAQLLNLNLVSELHVMRKQYLDGSIPTGFQRTVMVGLEGAIPFDAPDLGIKRDLRVRQLSLEEDSCRELSDEGHRITFATDRLGMPLTEVVTEPELFTPFEAQAAGRLLAQVARATRKVRRGPGAARQDVNVSVAGGRRVEIKGVHHHRRLPQLLHIEAFRQLNLLRIREKLHRRGVTTDLMTMPETGVPWEVSPLVIDARPILRDSQHARLIQALVHDETVCAVRLPGFGGLLAHRTQPRITFAQEFSERVRVIACPSHPGFMTHSEAGEGGITDSKWRLMRRKLHAESGDAVVLIWAPQQDAATAAREVLIRAQDAVVGIPPETRQAHADGTTGFERILPGPDRMYPDTDTPPVPIPDELVYRLRARLPDTPWALEHGYRDAGLAPVVARQLARSPWSWLFKAAAPENGASARRLAACLLNRLAYHRRHGGRDEAVDGERLRSLMRAIDSGDVRGEALDRMVDALAREPDTKAQTIVARFRRRGDESDLLDAAVRDVVVRSKMLAGRSAEALLRWAMGEVMPVLLGRVDPAKVHRRLKEALFTAAREATR